MWAKDRFVKYIKVHTTSDEQSGIHPSTNRQFDLAKILADELLAIGMQGVFVDENCYVYAYLPATEGYENAPALGFLSHMDTAPDASGENVNPIFHTQYDGSDVVYEQTGAVMAVSDFPFLKKFVGEELITSDGTTLLGADDKAGIAEIITAMEEIITENKPHGKICVAFTPDEEIGEGTDYFDLKKFGATFAYTVDGGDVNEIEYECFNAAYGYVDVTGIPTHTGDAKGKMVNATEVAMEFHAKVPQIEKPQTTEGYEGFYHLHSMKGEIGEAHLVYLLRDHDMEKFLARKEQMEIWAKEINSRYKSHPISVRFEDSYFNMRKKIEPHMHLIENAYKAVREAGYEPVSVAIRGGTDGARLSFEGLPCPNLGTGGYNFHGTFECITAERMDSAVKVIKKLVEYYAKY